MELYSFCSFYCPDTLVMTSHFAEENHTKNPENREITDHDKVPAFFCLLADHGRRRKLGDHLLMLAQLHLLLPIMFSTE